MSGSISISIIWALAAHTSLLANDPMLWFTMMLMPCGKSIVPGNLVLSDANDILRSGPTAMKLIVRSVSPRHPDWITH